jgi:glycosyltransferase involved in cell wall biosynthesis
MSEEIPQAARRLRIGMLAPVSWPVPPEGYGPWELVVANLTEELVARGHRVILYAAAGSKTSAELVETVPHAFSLWPPEDREAPEQLDPQSGLLTGPPNFRVLEQQHIAICMEAAAGGKFDLVHSHLHVHSMVFSRLIPCPMLFTLHGAAWARAIHPVLERYREQPVVSLSEAERRFKPDLNYVGTIPNGIRLDRFPLCREKDDFLLFAGRLAPEKGAAEAVEIARRTGRRLRMVGMIEPKYAEYFARRIKPHLDGRQIEYLGMLSQEALAREYQRAAAVVFPTTWAEPCGMVALEAMACGTPILGSRSGYLVELVEEGRTGFLFDTLDEAVRGVDRLAVIRPEDCRARIESRHSAAAMTDAYERIYYQLMNQRKAEGGRRKAEETAQGP